MHVHVLQHESFETPANIAHWATQRGARLSHTHFHRPGWRLPAAGGIDLLVVMGGPMGVHDDAAYPWLAEEKEFIRSCIGADKKILGVCLGAQLCAHALGASVTRNREKEIGFFPIRRTNASPALMKDMPREQVVFHWHGDTFDIPAGAQHLHTSEACANQSFLWKDRVLALQYHPEVSRPQVEEFITFGKEEIAAGGAFVQPEAAIRNGMAYLAPMESVLYRLLDRFVA